MPMHCYLVSLHVSVRTTTGHPQSGSKISERTEQIRSSNEIQQNLLTQMVS